MNFFEIISQGLGFVAVGVGFFLIQQKSRGRILIFKLICDVLWVAHFALIGAYSGMAISCVGCLREIVFFRKKDGDKGKAMLFVFLGIGVLSTIITWGSIWSVFSLISTVLSTTAYWQTKPNLIKFLLLLVALSQTAYAIASHSYAAILNEAITITSIIIFFVRYSVHKHRCKKGEIIS